MDAVKDFKEYMSVYSSTEREIEVYGAGHFLATLGRIYSFLVRLRAAVVQRLNYGRTRQGRQRVTTGGDDSGGSDEEEDSTCAGGFHACCKAT